MGDQPGGIWTGQGNHYWADDIYVSYCYYFCTPPVYAGTYNTTLLGSTASQTTAYYLVQIVEDHD